LFIRLVIFFLISLRLDNLTHRGQTNFNL